MLYMLLNDISVYIILNWDATTNFLRVLWVQTVEKKWVNYKKKNNNNVINYLNIKVTYKWFINLNMVIFSVFIIFIQNRILILI